MKWIAVILLVILLSFSESRNLQRRSHEDHPPRKIADVLTALGEEKFVMLSTILYCQYFQKNPYEDIVHLARDLIAFAQECKTDPQGQDCDKALITAYLDTACRHPDFGSQNEGFKECCSKNDPDRNTCFLGHKNTDPNFLPPYPKTPPEEICKNFHDDEKSSINHFLYEISRRHPYVHSPVYLATVINYKKFLTECCQDPTKLAACVQEKRDHLLKELNSVSAYHEHTCRVQKKFGTKVLQDEKLIQIAQKYPRSTMDMWVKLSHDITHLHEDCCLGDMLECTLDRMELTKFTCSHQDQISTKLKACCDLELGLQGECIVKTENDEKPEGLSEKVTQFIEDPAVCEHYAKEKDNFLAKFLTEYSIRHEKFSRQLILRAGKGYEEQLKECCQLENPVECLKKGEEKLTAAIIESETLLKENCDALQKLGPYHYQNKLIRRYHGKMPQIRPTSLIELTSHMVKVGEKCCAMSEEKQMPCSDEGLSIVIGKMCERQEKIHVNDKVSKCCTESYSEWRPCFSQMPPDYSYVPPDITPDMFNFQADLCTDSEKEAQLKKQMFLIQLLNVKPHLTDEQFETIAPQFLAMVGTCCKDVSPEACFAKEGAEFFKKCKEQLGA